MQNTRFQALFVKMTQSEVEFLNHILEGDQEHKEATFRQPPPKMG